MKKISLIVLLMMMSIGTMWSQNVNELLSDLKKEIAPDGRTAIWDVNTATQNGVVTLYGKVDSNRLNAAIEKTLNEKGVKFNNNLIILENMPETPWAFVKLSVASFRTAGRHAAEMATQGIMGMPVQLLDSDGDWSRVRMPDDYIAYVPANSLVKADAARMAEWKKA